MVSSCIKYGFSFLLCIGIQNINAHVYAQNVSLYDCFGAAEQLSPVNRQKAYYNTIARLKEESAKKQNYPQLMLNGRLTYQSDVFSLPFSAPGGEIPEIPKDQYQLSLTLNQNLYDGGVRGHTEKLIKAEEEVNIQQAVVELYQIKGLINQLYFGALLAQENEVILTTLKFQLKEQLKQVEAQVNNGVLLQSNASILKKEILTIDQQLISVGSDKGSFLKMLNLWTEKDISGTAVLEAPQIEVKQLHGSIKRPEMILFELQNKKIDMNRSLVATMNSPKISVFFTGGLGRPNPYNFFETDISEFYMAGIRLDWRLLDWGRNKSDLRVLDVQKDIVNSKKEDFERQLSINLIKDQSDIQKLVAMIAKDQEILDLQQEIVKESYSQLTNGLITSTAYLTEVSSETRAAVNAKIHRLTLLQIQFSELIKSGNL